LNLHLKLLQSANYITFYIIQSNIIVDKINLDLNIDQNENESKLKLICDSNSYICYQHDDVQLIHLNTFGTVMVLFQSYVLTLQKLRLLV